jgi:hypothetical protein
VCYASYKSTKRLAGKLVQARLTKNEAGYMLGASPHSPSWYMSWELDTSFSCTTRRIPSVGIRLPNQKPIQPIFVRSQISS